jgi:hypothetical protein
VENLVTEAILLILQAYLIFTDVVCGIGDLKEMLEEFGESTKRGGNMRELV